MEQRVSAVRTGGRLPLIAALLCSGLVSAHASAQGTVQTSTAGSTSGGAKGEIGLTVKPALTPEQQAQEADTIARRGGDISSRLTKMLGEARKDKDIMRANCVNRKLTEVNANLRNVDSRVGALKDALKTGDKDRGNHEFTVLSVLSQKFDMLDQEAAQCLGQSVFEPGASQVVTTVPNNVNVLTDPSVQSSPPPAPPSVTVPAPTSGTT